MKYLCLIVFIGFLHCSSQIESVIKSLPDLPPDGEKPKLDVRWGGTPDVIMTEMFRLAKITKEDVIYDLGCGDGRIVISAAKKYGTRGVGVDLDPLRINQSNENAERENVRDRVSFLCKNLFDISIAESSVLAIYLNKEVNRRLRPKIFSELKPGSRIVSHNWDMGEWLSDHTSRFEKRAVYYWVVPANASGVWQWSMGTGNGRTGCVLLVEQNYQKLRGSFFASGELKQPGNLAIRGEAVSFSAEYRQGGIKTLYTFEGKVKGEIIEGSIRRRDGNDEAVEIWNAKRNPGTMAMIYK